MQTDKNKPDTGAKAEKFNNLMRGIAHGSKGVLKRFYKSYGRLIYIAAYSVTRNAALADEVVNDVLLKIWRLSPNVRDIQNPEGWIYKVALNAAKDKSGGTYAALNDDLAYTDSGFLKVEADDSFYSMIACLDSQDKQIMQLRFIGGYSFKEIAAILGSPVSSVTSAYYRALEKIKKNLKN